MYGGFWDNLKNAFKYSNNSLYKLLAINLIVFFVMLFFRVVMAIGGAGAAYGKLIGFLMLPADLGQLLFQPWTLFTYMFLHEGIFHILFNMLFLYWFGLIVNEYLGSRKLANIYVLGGLAGAALYLLIYNISPMFSESVSSSRMLGASAGVYAVVVGAATLDPNRTFQLLILGPVKIKYIALFYVIIAFANSAGANAGGELAHLGGAAMGFFYILQLKKGNDLGRIVQTVGQFFEKLFKARPAIRVTYRRKGESPDKSPSFTVGGSPKESEPSKKFGSKSSSSSRSALTTQEEIDAILDKIAEKGYDSLSKDEKRKLFEFSKKN
ncbi:rhomboid family protein [Nitritalea halalkaliphila LW7]|uniref:Rhomboid family protein n=1 Tax=Nitritalea halalkaliphila LW7 TaxID=1189621 RepID=I5C2A9_9BACT|nr:rhomboid family intramembrane serine protease [Nitritalea halalkaliphila]EIM75961.1 rhomboid family protein [Nitritalea halalkaliphila LW7]